MAQKNKINVQQLMVNYQAKVVTTERIISSSPTYKMSKHWCLGVLRCDLRSVAGLPVVLLKTACPPYINLRHILEIAMLYGPAFWSVLQDDIHSAPTHPSFKNMKNNYFGIMLPAQF